MRSGNPNRCCLLPLLPIFLVGLFPMLLLACWDLSVSACFGILLICVGLTDALEANS